MTDDSLNDTQRKQFTNHCKACDINYETDTRTGKHNCPKPDSVGITDKRSVVVKQNEKEYNKIWNAAIEAVFKEIAKLQSVSQKSFEAIEKLKK